MVKPLTAALRAVLRAADARIVAVAAAETLVWAGIYYLFPALLLHWEHDLGWSKTDLSGALTLALVVSALGAPVMGRLIDRGHGRVLLTGCAVLGGAAIAALAFVETLGAFYALWFVAGVAMAGCLYEPCFAFITHARPHSAKRAITLVTLAAGFASTLAFPLANAVAGAFGWRASALLFALLIVCAAAPLFWFGAKSRRGATATIAAPTAAKPPKVLATPKFWFLGAAFAMTGLTHGMLISHYLPMMNERGADTALAVLSASLIGPMQVVGRILMMTFERRVSVFAVAGLSFAFMTAASTTLYLTAPLAAGLVAFAMLQGSGYGVTSIVKPVVTARILGRANFGAISGALAVPYMMSYALAPTLAAGVWGVGGYDLVLLLAIALPMAGLAAFALAARRPQDAPARAAI